MPPTPIDQWRSLNVILKVYKMIGLFLGIVAIILSAIVLYLVNAPPVVVVWKDGEKHFFHTERRKIAIDEKDIRKFVVEYVSLRYGDHGRSILEEIKPLVTDRFLKQKKNKLAPKKSPLGHKTLGQSVGSPGCSGQH